MPSKRLKKTDPEGAGDPSSDSDSDSEFDVAGMPNIKVDFEAFALVEEDTPGIRRLLQQSYLPSKCLEGVAELLVGQSDEVGTVLKQSVDSEDDDSDEATADEMPLYGVTSILGLTYHAGRGANGPKHFLDFIKEKGVSLPPSPVGWLINERLVNLPPAIGAPAIGSLAADLESLRPSAAQSLTFSHLLVVAKALRPRVSRDDKDDLFLQAEEQALAEVGRIVLCWELEVAQGSDNASSTSATSNDEEFKALRKVIMFERKELDRAIEKMKQMFPAPEGAIR